MSGQLQSSAALPLGKQPLQPGGWVGPTANLDVMESGPYRELNQMGKGIAKEVFAIPYSLQFTLSLAPDILTFC
jgi:hypothetical protein